MVERKGRKEVLYYLKKYVEKVEVWEFCRDWSKTQWR